MGKHDDLLSKSREETKAGSGMSAFCALAGHWHAFFNPPMKVITLNNPDMLAQVGKAAESIIDQIERECEDNLEAANEAYLALNGFGRFWHRHVLAIAFPPKSKYVAIEVAEAERGFKYLYQYEFCKEVIAKLAISSNLDLSERDCRLLQLTNLWERTSKMTKKSACPRWTRAPISQLRR